MRKRNGVILAVIGCIVFFFCMELWGADWKVIGRDVQDSICEIDVASISRLPNNIVRVWLKITYSQEGITEVVTNYGPTFKDLFYSKIFTEIDCAESKYRILGSTYYSSDDGVIHNDNSFSDWHFITPNSMARATFKEVCK